MLVSISGVVAHGTRAQRGRQKHGMARAKAAREQA